MMPLYALAVALESAITGRWLARPMRERLGLAYRLAELVFLLTLAPLALWLSSGQVPVPTSLVDVLQNPLTVFSVPLLLYMLLAVLVWQQTHSWTDLFAQLSDDFIADRRRRIPMGRFCTVAEIAAMAVFAASPACSFTTGFTFDVSGGRATY